MLKLSFRSKLLASVAVGAASLLLSTGAFAGGSGNSAGPVSEAGETIGLGLGAALPQGVYFVDTASFVHNPGANASSGHDLDVLVNIPVVAWSTPWDLLGGHVEAYAALPEATTSTHGTAAQASSTALNGSGLYNPALLVGEAWNLGHGFNVSDFVGGYAPVYQPGFSEANATNNVWTFNERAAVTYNANGYDLTAHAIYGHSTNDTSSKDTGVNSVSCALTTCYRADYLNVDLTATKTFGKWEVGPVGYYTVDVGHDAANDPGNREFALGGLVGYNMGPVTFQTYATHDVSNSEGHLLGGPDNRFFFRVITALWNPSSK